MNAPELVSDLSSEPKTVGPADHVSFALAVHGGRIHATGIGVPLAAEAPTLDALRARLLAAVREYFGHELRITMLVGASEETKTRATTPAP